MATYKPSMSLDIESKEPPNRQCSALKTADYKRRDVLDGLAWLVSMAALGGAIVLGMRSLHIPFFGYDLNVFLGGIPIECLIWTIAIIVLVGKEVWGVLEVLRT